MGMARAAPLWMSLLDSRRLRRWLGSYLLCRVEGATGRFALTFDDGPSPTHTPRILDLLERRGVRATFFVLGPHVRRHPALVRRLAEAGHEIGIHGESHLPPALKPGSVLSREIERIHGLVFDLTGHRPRFYRPPFGLITPGQARLLRERGHRPVLGDVYPDDAERPGAANIAARALARLGEGSILLLHDASATRDFDRSQTVEALDIILTEMANRGVSAGPLGEIA